MASGASTSDSEREPLPERQADNPFSSRAKFTFKKKIILGILVCIIAMAMFIRMGLLTVPLERDEGEYAYAGQLMLQGAPPYTEAYNMKMPGIYAAYALMMGILGENTRGIRLGLLIVNGLTIFVVFLIGCRLRDSTTGLPAAASFAVLSLGAAVQGVIANAEHFVLLPALAGIWLLLRPFEKRRMAAIFSAGLLLGLGFIVKQHGALFALFGGLYVLFRRFDSKTFSLRGVLPESLLYALGAITPFCIAAFVLYLVGAFDKFWFWTFTYASEYVSSLSLKEGVGNFFGGFLPIMRTTFPIWILAAAGIAPLLWKRENRNTHIFALMFFLFSLFAVCPGFYFRPHYFLLLLPSVSVLSGMGGALLLDRTGKRGDSKVSRSLGAGLLALVCIYPVYAQKEYLFQMSPKEVSRALYGVNPFPESLEIARYIEANSAPGDRIAVFGSEPQIYFYAKRRSATGHIYTYALMEDQPYALEMQRQMIREIESSDPEYLVFIKVPSSWLAGPRSNRLIFKWFNEYRKERYEKTGQVDILSLEKTDYIWGEEAVGKRPRSEFFVDVFRKK